MRLIDSLQRRLLLKQIVTLHLTTLALLHYGAFLGPSAAFAQTIETEPESTIEQAHRAFQEGRYAEAEELWRQVVVQQPKSAEAFYQLGFSLHLQEEIGAAIAAYREAIALNSNYDAPHLNLGLALIELQQLDEATQSFERVLALPDRSETPASTHTLAHYNLSIMHKRQDHAKIAQQNIEAALKISPDFSPAQELRLQLLNPQPQE